MFYSGIDQHKRDSFITTYDDGGAIVNQERVPNTPLRIQRYFAQFPGPHQAVVESTGSWYWLADLLQHLNVELSLAHATRLKAISAAKVKTDKVDSDILALLLRANLIPEAHMICPDQRSPARPQTPVKTAVGAGGEGTFSGRSPSARNCRTADTGTALLRPPPPAAR